MLSNIEYNILSVLILEREQLSLRSTKTDVEYIMIDRWLKNRIRELENKNDS